MELSEIPENWAEIHKQRIYELAVEKTETILLNEFKIHLGSQNNDLEKIYKVLENPKRKIVGIQMMCHQVSVSIGIKSEELEEAVSSVSYMLAGFEFFKSEYQNLLGDIPIDKNGLKIFPEPIEAIISKGIDNADLTVIQGLDDLLKSGKSLL